MFLIFTSAAGFFGKAFSGATIAAGRVEQQLPPLSHIAQHGNSQWEKIKR